MQLAFLYQSVLGLGSAVEETAMLETLTVFVLCRLLPKLDFEVGLNLGHNLSFSEIRSANVGPEVCPCHPRVRKVGTPSALRESADGAREESFG